MIGIIKEPYFMGWWKKGIKRTHLSKIPQELWKIHRSCLLYTSDAADEL